MPDSRGLGLLFQERRTVVEVTIDTDVIADQAERLLAPLGRRWRHVRGVAAAAGQLGEAIGEDRTTLVAAAYLHDIGYAPVIATTGFHPLDGARFVRDIGLAEVAPLVAHHTGARNEAALRTIALVEEFPFEDSTLYRALTYCDLTTSPDGSRMNVDERVAEIVDRYGSDHVVSRGIMMGLPEFKAIETEFDELLSLSGSQASRHSESPSP